MVSPGPPAESSPQEALNKYLGALRADERELPCTEHLIWATHLGTLFNS